MKERNVSKTVSVQAFLPRALYAEVKKLCAETGITIKDLIKETLVELIKDCKFGHREWRVTNEEYNTAMEHQEHYLKIRDKVESENLHEEIKRR